jgi:hypothetical protein
MMVVQILEKMSHKDTTNAESHECRAMVMRNTNQEGRDGVTGAPTKRVKVLED